MLKEKKLFFVLMHFSDKWLQPFFPQLCQQNTTYCQMYPMSFALWSSLQRSPAVKESTKPGTPEQC